MLQSTRARMIVIAALLLAPAPLRAEDGHAAWLRYAPLPAAAGARMRDLVPSTVVTLGDGAPLLRARDEVVRGARGSLGRALRLAGALGADSAIVLGTQARLRQA